MNSLITKPVTVLLICWPLLAEAWDWSAFGPEANILNFYTGPGPYMEVLCAEEGLIVNEDGNWEIHTYAGLPVLDVTWQDMENMLLVQGNGSYSDGIYAFNSHTHSFEIRHFCLNPRFIERGILDDGYVVGYEEGLLVSPYGNTWTEIPFFAGYCCSDIVRWDSHIVICGIDGIHSSADGGMSWETAAPGAPWIEEMAFDQNGKLYGIFPDESWSSGLWSSNDFGLTWEVEFWSIDMSDVYCVAGEVYVSWLEPWLEYSGIAHWDPGVEVLTFMNDGLPEVGVNEFSEHTLLDCYNLVGCMQNGAWITCDVMHISLEVEICYGEGCVCLSWPDYPGALSYRVYSSQNPHSGYSLETGGVHTPNGWCEEVAGDQKFYYVTAVMD